MLDYFSTLLFNQLLKCLKRMMCQETDVKIHIIAFLLVCRFMSKRSNVYINVSSIQSLAYIFLVKRHFS
jgi:hypothetical protein